MSELALNADGLVLGVPLRGLVWEYETAMDRALADLDDRDERVADDEAVYWPVDSEVAGGR